MSGIVGMMNLDGSPIDRELLNQMTGFQAFRGPDAQDIWVDGPVGFGHTLLRTTFESEHERQPCSLDGQVWITADARIDDRANLIDKLAGHGRQATLTVPDVELILHAYHVWGERCVDHLLGDFAFTIWDGRERRLFCARDHFGVKPFFYARVDNSLVFSNTLNCLRQHPDVSAQLNDLAIADFLLFGRNLEPATTPFADIQRLPAAHCLTCREDQWHLRRYWTLPIDGHVRYRRANDYVERFNELFQCAVGDRLRTTRVAVMMSGGLDSTSIAATAKAILSEKGRPFDLRAFSSVYDRLIPDQERHYSGLAAAELGIPIHYQPLDDYQLYDRWDEVALRIPEPIESPFALALFDFSRLLASHSRVVFSGIGGDPTLLPSPNYFGDLLSSWRFGQAFLELARYSLAYRRLPPLGTGLIVRLNSWFGKTWPDPALPSWLNKDLANRLELPARCAQRVDGPPKAATHALRPLAYGSLVRSWAHAFEEFDPGVSSFPFEVRYPFFDIRLVNYLLAIPPLPWFVDKEILRVAMRGRLPESIRLRPKTPVAGSPLLKLCQAGAGKWVDQFDPDPRLSEYVERAAIPRVTGDNDPSRVWQNMRPLCLNYWFRHSLGVRKGGISNGIRSTIQQPQR